MAVVLGWTTLSDPLAATACAAVADGAGLLAMLPKVLLLFPLYFCVGNSATATVIGLRRRALRDRGATLAPAV